MANLYLRINLSKIPKELMRQAENKDWWVSLNVGELKSKDEHGNDHYVSVYVPKEQRRDGDKPIFIGRGQMRGENSPQGGSRENSQRPINKDTDLPF